MQFGLKCSFPGPGGLSELTRREEGSSLSLLTLVSHRRTWTRSTDSDGAGAMTNATQRSPNHPLPLLQADASDY